MKIFKTTLLAGIAAAAAFAGGSAPAQAQEPFLGQISAFGFNFCPRGWAATDGQLLSIAQNTALFSILGTTYGGDGRTTFGLPDLRGRHPIHEGTGPGLSTYRLGQKSGFDTITLTSQHLPSHSHLGALTATTDLANTTQPVRNSFARTANTQMYQTAPPPDNFMNAGTVRINNTGGNQAFGKRSPYTALNFCIATQGTFPSRS